MGETWIAPKGDTHTVEQGPGSGEVTLLRGLRGKRQTQSRKPRSTKN